MRSNCKSVRKSSHVSLFWDRNKAIYGRREKSNLNRSKQSVATATNGAVKGSGSGSHGRTGRKKLGGRKQICPTFPDFARLLQKIFSGDDLF